MATAVEERRRDGAGVERERAGEVNRIIESTIGLIKKKHGDGAIMRFGEVQNREIPVISTGSLSLDHALGIGGLPRGRIVEIYGPESSGKTTLSLHVIANAQKLGGTAAFIDAEHALDPTYARKLGVHVDSLLIAQPDYGEQALEICEMLVGSGALDVVVIDSVAALVPKAELEGAMGDSHVGLQARLMSQALRKLTAMTARSQTCVIFINQIREKIGVMFGNPETTTGGRALKFYASVRLDIRRIGKLTVGEETIGNRTRAKVAKNKLAPPFRQAEFDILYSKGISWAGDVLDLAVAHRIVTKSGAWYSFGETRLGQGRERAVAFLEENPEVLLEIEAPLMAALFPPQSLSEPAAVPEPAAATPAGGTNGSGGAGGPSKRKRQA
ncbi:MAG: DNA recombination/repair protein RecA [Planctomycetota bacterium]|nr:MAG: DNA recombination/repair protein RecA [Planctomycetota bacterium]